MALITNLSENINPVKSIKFDITINHKSNQVIDTCIEFGSTNTLAAYQVLDELGENELFDEYEILERDTRVDCLKDHTYLILSTKASEFQRMIKMFYHYAEDFKANPKVLCNLIRNEKKKSFFDKIESLNIESGSDESFVYVVGDGLKRFAEERKTRDDI